MPRARRLSPGQGARGGGGLHALADILHGIFGGVEANPEYGTQGPTPDGTPLGGQPYKAKTIFDRARASEMNAAYMADESLAENDVSRALRTTEGMTPLLANRAREIGGANTEVEVGRRQALRPEEEKDIAVKNKGEIDLQRILAGIELLKSKGAIPTERNTQAYDAQVSPSAINAAGQGYDTQAAKGSLEEILATIAQDQASATRGSDLNTAVANSQFGETRAKALLGESGRLNTAEIVGRIQKPMIEQSNAMANRITPVAGGVNLIDILSPNKPLYTGPLDPMQQKIKREMEAEAGIPPTGGDTLNNGGGTSQPQVYDPKDMIIVGGETYIRSRR